MCLIGSQLPKLWSSAEELRAELSSELQRMRVLLILDDVWNSSHFQELMITSSNPKLPNFGDDKKPECCEASQL